MTDVALSTMWGNSFYYLEIPPLTNWRHCWDLGYDQVIGYWHDVGRAQVLENSGPATATRMRFARFSVGFTRVVV